MAEVVGGGVVGLVVGVLLAWWLPKGRYRRIGDVTRLAPRRLTVFAVPAAAALGGALAATQDAAWFVAATAVYLAAGVALVWIDLDVHRVPDRVLAPAAAALVVTIIWGGLTDGPQVWLHAATGAVGVGLFFLVLAVVGSMGLGDVKLALVTGMLVGPLGWGTTVAAVFAAFLLGGFAGVVLLLLRGRRGNEHVAFGQPLIAGAALTIAWTQLGL